MKHDDEKDPVTDATQTILSYLLFATVFFGLMLIIYG
jgi:hypothetical protein